MTNRTRQENSRVLKTAHDVARAAGVSQSAVSRAFTPGASVAAGTRAKILAAAKKLGYQPNLIARSLISGRSNLVGLGVGNLRNPFSAEALERFSIALEKVGLRLLLFPTVGTPTLGTEMHEVLHYRLDALILLSATLTSTLAAQCRQAQVPVVQFNRMATDPDVSSVTGNNEIGARTIAAFLHAGGHRRPAIITGADTTVSTKGARLESPTSGLRERGFRSYFVERGLPPPISACGYFDHDGAMAAMRRLLSSSERPDAVFCVNDFMAIAALNVVRFEFGLEPGRDISIVGYDDAPPAAWPAFSLTTFAQPIDRMVARTIEIIEQLRQDPQATTQAVVDGQLVVRSSARTPQVGARPERE
jgi:DNA-binding LacI/PurR family transcriptional regulator